MTAAPSTDGHTATAFESAELIDLFLAYSASPDSIGAQFVARLRRRVRTIR